MKKFLWLLLVLLALSSFGIYGYAQNLPQSYEVTRRTIYDQPIAAVWEAVTEYKALPEWEPSIASAERREDVEEQPVWRLTGDYGFYVDVQVVKSQEPNIQMVQIIDTNLPYSGSWSFYLSEKKEGITQLIMKEEGSIPSPICRLMLHFLFGKEALVDHYLVKLGDKFGEIPVIREEGE